MYNCPISNTQTATGTGKALYAKRCNEVAWNDRTRAQRRGREQEIQLRPDYGSQDMRNGSSQLRNDEEQRGKQNEQTWNRQRTSKQQLRRTGKRNCLTIATLHKEVEKSRKELATEKTDNERLKKMLSRLQSSQSDQMSKVVSDVEELCMKLKTAEFEKEQLLETLESCQRHHSEELNIMEEFVKKRIQAIAESHEGMEEGLKNEVATTMAYYKRQVEELVREGK